MNFILFFPLELLLIINLFLKKGTFLAWILYIIQTKSGKLYTGITTNLERRFKEHCSSKKGASFFNFSEPDVILYQEGHINRSEASKREYQIKQMTKQQKLNLIIQSQMKRS